jgi:hypothetical protein
MSTRNFDSRVITDRLQSRNHARYQYQQRSRGNLILSNPQTANGNASMATLYQEGTMTTYQKGLLGGTITEQVGGLFGLPLVDPPPSLLPAPPLLQSLTAGDESLTVFFLAIPPTPEGFTRLKYTLNGVTFLPFPGTTSPQTITALTNNQTYTVRLRIWNAYGPSALSNALTETPVSPFTPPAAPTLLTVLSADAAAYVYFTAGASDAPITNYEYTFDDVTWLTLDPADALTPIKLSGLTNNQLYTVRLRALSAGGTSAASNALTVTPQVATVPTAALAYDPNDPASYSGGSAVLNVGAAGVVTGTKTAGVDAIQGTNLARTVFDFAGTDSIQFGGYDFGSAFTVTAWVYPRNRASINGLIANVGANVAPSGFKIGWNNWNSTNRTMLLEAGNGSTGGADASIPGTIIFDEWQHVAYIVDVVNQLVFFLRNGEPVDTATYSDNRTVPSIGTNNPTFRIGTFTDGSYGMNAQLAVLRVYSGARSVGEIQAEWNAERATYA